MERIRNVEFVPVTANASEKEIQDLSEFATAIVREHFNPIIGKAQNDYMIEKFQSPESIRAQIEDGYRYYWVQEDGKHAGFMAFYPRNGKMYLSKFYTYKAFRGHHLAGRMLAFLEEQTRREGLSAIYLNVNKNNSNVIAIYEHLGFQVVSQEKNPIGEGFFMDDYVLEKMIL